MTNMRYELLVKELQAWLIFFYLRVPNLPAEGWTKLSEYSVSLVHTCIFVRTCSVCILSMLALTVFCLGSVFCLTSAMLICTMFALYSIIARRVLFFVFQNKQYICISVQNTVCIFTSIFSNSLILWATKAHCIVAHYVDLCSTLSSCLSRRIAGGNESSLLRKS